MEERLHLLLKESRKKFGMQGGEGGVGESPKSSAPSPTVPKATTADIAGIPTDTGHSGPVLTDVSSTVDPGVMSQQEGPSDVFSVFDDVVGGGPFDGGFGMEALQPTIAQPQTEHSEDIASGGIEEGTYPADDDQMSFLDAFGAQSPVATPKSEVNADANADDEEWGDFASTTFTENVPEAESPAGKSIAGSRGDNFVNTSQKGGSLPDISYMLWKRIGQE
jgi:hypothetical protein